MSNRAIIVVDIQNEYFPGGQLPLEGIEKAVTNAAKVIEHARSVKDLVVYFQHESADSEIPFFTPGTQEVAIHPVVAPLDQETVLVKHFPNSFRETGLKALLDQQNIEEVVIIGAMSHMCIDATSRAASDLGYKTTIVHDACATLDLEFDGVMVPATQVHATIMAALAFAYGTVTATEHYIG
ncbi:cysteine hydrolase family protein [Vreelandella neptunia]|uniref:Cysteine hydrolase family protein n=1 Tax=Vreelandella neptunia TaxID=115551 RepID=A0ABZ0YMC2_9GAMM|nr:cysteine hydrolase family protein [Halomonas neptunia]MDN3562709.1 cysteine hydrolase family protein [Halomonas neptunia]WQH12380.1 cysteine hydrolase family protein [Halomonas neptunia]